MIDSSRNNRGWLTLADVDVDMLWLYEELTILFSSIATMFSSDNMIDEFDAFAIAAVAFIIATFLASISLFVIATHSATDPVPNSFSGIVTHSGAEKPRL